MKIIKKKYEIKLKQKEIIKSEKRLFSLCDDGGFILIIKN